jgi:plasmid stabilization system protein ParE
MNYHFITEAQDDLREAAEYYNSRRTGLGFEFAVEVGIAISRVLEAPHRWPELAPAVHKYRLDRFPYAIIYRVPRTDQVEVIAVFNLRRQPDSWKGRMN